MDGTTASDIACGSGTLDGLSAVWPVTGKSCELLGRGLPWLAPAGRLAPAGMGSAAGYTAPAGAACATSVTAAASAGAMLASVAAGRLVSNSEGAASIAIAAVIADGSAAPVCGWLCGDAVTIAAGGGVTPPDNGSRTDGWFRPRGAAAVAIAVALGDESAFIIGAGCCGAASCDCSERGGAHADGVAVAAGTVSLAVASHSGADGADSAEIGATVLAAAGAKGAACTGGDNAGPTDADDSSLRR
jgi:hypothetical protein